MFNKLMSAMIGFLGSGSAPSDALSDSPSWLVQTFAIVWKVIDDILWPAFAIIATLGIVYAIVLGVNYAKAETSDKKEEAKKRIINAVVGVVVMLALIVILKVFVSNIAGVREWADNLTKK